MREIIFTFLGHSLEYFIIYCYLYYTNIYDIWIGQQLHNHIITYQHSNNQ